MWVLWVSSTPASQGCSLICNRRQSARAWKRHPQHLHVSGLERSSTCLSGHGDIQARLTQGRGLRVLARALPSHGQFTRAVGDRFCAAGKWFTLLFALSSPALAPVRWLRCRWRTTRGPVHHHAVAAQQGVFRGVFADHLGRLVIVPIRGIAVHRSTGRRLRRAAAGLGTRYSSEDTEDTSPQGAA